MLIGQPWLVHRMLNFCALDVLQRTVTSSGTSLLDVLSLPEEHIRRRIKTLISSPGMMFFQSWQQRKTSQTFS
jgi:hypothetical protein